MEPHFLTSAFITAVDAAVIMLPLLLLPPRWMGRVAVALLWLLAAFVEVNLLYFRFFHDLTPLPSFFMTGNFGMVLLRSALRLLRLADVILLLVAGSYMLLWRLWWRHGVGSLTWRWRCGAAVGIVALFAAQQVKFSVMIRNVAIDDIWVEHPNPATWLGAAYSSVRLYSFFGFSVYTTGSICDVIFNNRSIKELTPEQKALVGRAISPVQRSAGDYSANRRKNLFLIIVESFDSWPVGRMVGGRAVTPVIDSLMRSGIAMWSTEMVSQIRDGGSSDGQMFYNTGLAPISRDATVQYFADNRFPSLAGELRRAGYATAVEVIHDDKALWNHSATTKAWGYDVLHDIDSLSAWPRYNPNAGGDSQLFGYAAELAGRLLQPFMMEITTISMHTPFRLPEADVDPAMTDPTLDATRQAFLQVTHYFDSCLGRFLESLRRGGLLESSVIVIAADHEAPMDAVGREPIFFMALGAGGYVGRIEGVMGQIDVYPTVLELMGRLDAASWQGLGRSVAAGLGRGALVSDGSFAGSPSDADMKIMREAFEVSDLIIRSDYFKNSNLK